VGTPSTKNEFSFAPSPKPPGVGAGLALTNVKPVTLTLPCRLSVLVVIVNVTVCPGAAEVVDPTTNGLPSASANIDIAIDKMNIIAITVISLFFLLI
jgi:hypothetical protein